MVILLSGLLGPCHDSYDCEALSAELMLLDFFYFIHTFFYLQFLSDKRPAMSTGEGPLDENRTGLPSIADVSGAHTYLKI